MANAIPKGQIIDKAYPLEGQSNLTKMQVMLLFFLLGLIAVPVWLYIRNMFRTKISGRSDLAELTSVPVVGSIGKDNSGDHLISFDNDNEAAETFCHLRGNLQFLMANGTNKVVQISSMASGAGKTFISSNFAVCIAQSGKKIALVDMDIRNPKIAEYFNLPEASRCFAIYR